jgi:sugar lactone lactonase YvrE
VTPEGEVTTVAGTPGVSGNTDGKALEASFNSPADVAIDASGSLFVADSGNHVIRRIAPDGTVSTFAGAAGEAGGLDGPRLEARFHAPALLAFGPGDALYVVESSHTLRQIDSSGQVRTLAGRTGEPGYFDGPAPLARFRFPAGLAVMADGTAVVADFGNNAVREVPPDGETRTIAGMAVPGAADGTGLNARFNGPAGLTVDAAGVLYVTDWNNSTIRRISPQGEVTTLAGSPANPGTEDGTGRLARFMKPADVVLDSHGDLLVVDWEAHTVRRVTPQGAVSTVAGSGGQPGASDGPGDVARFNHPNGVAIGPDDTLYIADSENHTVRRIDNKGLVSTIAGSPGVPGDADGPAAEARFSFPYDIAVDKTGNLYVADAQNNSLRMITPQGRVATVAGYGGRPGTADGHLRAARFRLPISLAVDPAGNLLVADYQNLTLRRMTPSGDTTTIAGAPGFPSLADGIGAAARFKAPGGLAIDKSGLVYISDFTGNVIRTGRAVP